MNINKEISISGQQKHKVALLIPCTSKGRSWKNIQETYLINYSIKTFLLTQNKEHFYTFYIGYDLNDHIFDNKENHKYISRYSQVFRNIKFTFIPMIDVQKGHLTKMWNILFDVAYKDGNEYFFQCGDDIFFTTKNWVNDCISTLKQHKNIGLSGPMNNNSRILTQAFVSRLHMDIFGYFFPEEIINWCCDDWYNEVYKPNYFYPLTNHFCSNQGGPPRYYIDNNKDFLKDKNSSNLNIIELREKTMKIVTRDKRKINIYLNKNT